MNKAISNKLIFIENECHDPHYNLAFEEYVFKNIAKNGEDDKGTPILLLWQNEPSVIIGKYQNTIEEINYDYIKEASVHVVRRNTGGGAVYHDLGNLNYSFIIPDVEMQVDFKTFTGPMVKALQSQGVNAEQTGRNDILVDGKKFSGNAQQFSGNKLLHHGTIMFDVEMDAVAKSLKVKPGKFKSKAVKSVRSRVTNLKPYFHENVDVIKFKALLLEWFAREYDLEVLELSQSQLAEIQALKVSKYDTEEWNFDKSPKSDVTRGEFFRCGYVEFNFSLVKHKIQNMKLTGDFFSSGEIEDFENLFEGCEYSKEALQAVLDKVDLRTYLGDITAEEIIEVII